MTPEEKLAQIAALCDDAKRTGFHTIYASSVRAVLDAPSVSAARAGGIDRDAAEVIADLHLATGAGWKDDGRAGFIDSVRGILATHARVDRTALIDLLRDETGWEWDGEQDEPAPIFGCDTRVPSSKQMLEELADRILALVQPAPPALDREKARDVLNSLGYGDAAIFDVDGILDAFEGCVTPALDLGVVRRILTDALPVEPRWRLWVDGRIEEIAALTPSEGVVLTPEEAAYAARWLPTKNSQRARDLAARLERAAS